MADPRLQLYTAAEAKLLELSAEFRKTPEAIDYDDGMIDSFLPLDNTPRFSFADSRSSFEADSAQFINISRHKAGEMVMHLALYRDSSPYQRKRDNSDNLYDLFAFAEGVPVLLPTDQYVYTHQDFNDIKIMLAGALQRYQALTGLVAFSLLCQHLISATTLLSIRYRKS